MAESFPRWLCGTITDNSRLLSMTTTGRRRRDRQHEGARGWAGQQEAELDKLGVIAGNPVYKLLLPPESRHCSDLCSAFCHYAELVNWWRGVQQLGSG